MRQQLSRNVFSIRQAALLCRIVGTACSEDNSGIGCELGLEKIEKESVSNVVDLESRFCALRAI